MKNEDFRRSGHQFVDWIADYFENVEKFPVVPAVEPGEEVEREGDPFGAATPRGAG